MKAGLRRGAWLAGAAASLIGAALAWSFAAGAPADAVDTIVVQRGRFVREVVASGTLRAVRATPIVVPMETGRAQKVAFIAPDGAAVKAGEVVVRFDPLEAQREEADGRDDLVTAEGKTEKALAEGGRTRRSLHLDRDLARTELERARSFVLTDSELYSRHQIVESELDRDLQERKAHTAGDRVAASDAALEAGVAMGRIEADKARLRLRQARQSLGALTIVAPHDGLFALDRDWREETAHVGATLWPGEKIAEIPNLDELSAQVYALEADAAGLKPGLPARLRIEGRPGEWHAAKVASVQPVARPRTRNSPVRYFEATLSLERTVRDVMRPGQEVEATILLEELNEAIAIPRGALFEKDGRRLVYLQRGGRFEAAEVSVGPNSASRVVVTGGLEPGDVVALRDPSLRRASALSGRASAGAKSGS